MLIYISPVDDYDTYHRKAFLNELAKGADASSAGILFFRKPVSIFKYLFKRNKSEQHSGGNIEVRNVITLLPLSRFNNTGFWFFLGVTLPIKLQLKYHLSKIGFSGPKIVWLCKPEHYLIAKGLKEKYVYEHYDNYEDDQNYAYNKRANFKKQLLACAQNSSVSFCSSKKLIERYSGGIKWHYLPNAVDEIFLLKNKKITTNSRKRVIGFVGNLDSTIDIQLLTLVASTFPDTELRLIGPVNDKAFYKLAEQYKNVSLIGPIPHSSVPEQLSEFSVGICPYVVNEFNKYRNPLKLYEYLAAGIPSVSTSCDFDDKALAFITIVTQQDEFISAIGDILDNKIEGRSEDIMEYIKKNTWTCRAKQALNIIEQY